MELEVISYSNDGRFHNCRDAQGATHRVDLIVDGSLPDTFAENPALLNGKSVEIGFLAPYIEIANDGVRVVEDDDEVFDPTDPASRMYDNEVIE